MVFRLSTLSSVDTDGVDYKTGDLSLFPEALDDRKSLYLVANNAETKLKQSITYNGKHLICEDASKFPPYGLIRVGGKPGYPAEIIYYDSRNDTTFLNLVRGFAGSRQDTWPVGTVVGNAVMAEIHNATKDALLNIQQDLGTKSFPSADSLNGILKSLESKFLAPNPQFRAFPLSGTPPLTVKFQNFTNNQAIRFLWDFGDGNTSAERSPTYTYQSEGSFTVKLNTIMSTGGQGIKIKKNYINVSNEETVPFFYSVLKSSTNEAPATYELIDQTDGDIAARYWVFDDGENTQALDPNQHSIEHTYTEAGEYIPSLLIEFKDQTLKRVFLTDGITVI